MVVYTLITGVKTMNQNDVKNVTIRDYYYINNRKLQNWFHVEIEVTDLGDSS